MQGLGASDQVIYLTAEALRREGTMLFLPLSTLRDEEIILLMFLLS